MNNNLLSLLVNILTGLFGSGGKEVSTSVTLPLDKDSPSNSRPEDELSNVNLFIQNNNGYRLSRSRVSEYGVFGELSKDGQHVCYTLEHNFDGKPKVAPGTYKCVRGQHQLHSTPEPFTTFEITGVPHFQGKSVSGILLHWGNYDKDSDGCVLVGKETSDTMISNSKEAFADLMELLNGIDSFNITIV